MIYGLCALVIIEKFQEQVKGKMIMKHLKNHWLSGILPYSLVGVAVYIAGMLLSGVNQFAAGFTMLLGAIALYLYIVFKVAEGNWLDVRAVFTGVWTGTIGLAALQFAEYQEVWQLGTWVSLILAFLMMQIGATAGIHLGPKLYSSVQQRLQAMNLNAIKLKVQENRLFAICVITTLIGFLCFSINVAIKGYIPCFSDDVTAYKDFYTKFHIFSVASTAVAGLCFYCVKTQPLAFWKKAVLLLCIFYLVFAFPIMVVSRGVFVTGALSLAVTVFYLYRKKLIALIVCMAVILGVYILTSNLRNFTEDQMKVFFQPAQIELPGQLQTTTPPVETPPVETPPVETPPVETPPVETLPVETPPVETPPVETPPVETPPVETPPVEPPKTFQLPPKVAFLYSYLTVSHDNLNEAVKHLQNYTWGIRQLAPFNVLLRSNTITETIANAEHYQVNPFLNTINLIGDFYYDLGIVGVVIFMLMWSFIFGLNQGAYNYSKNIFLLLILGNTMTPVALCFFSTWLSNFNQWMMWGTVFLLAVAACLTFKRKDSHSQEPEKT